MTNLSPLYGTAQEFSDLRENIGSLSNIIDGNDSTVYGFNLSNDPVSGPLLPWYINYRINFDSTYFVESITIKHELSGTTVGSPGGWLTKANLNIFVRNENNTSFEVGSSTLYSPTENTYSVGFGINRITLTAEIDGVMGRVGNESFYIKEIYATGISRGDSTIRIASLSGNITIAKNTDLYGPLRYRNDTGIESIALVKTSDPKASNIRIQTASGIKALAKL